MGALCPSLPYLNETFYSVCRSSSSRYETNILEQKTEQKVEMQDTHFTRKRSPYKKMWRVSESQHTISISLCLTVKNSKNKNLYAPSKDIMSSMNNHTLKKPYYTFRYTSFI